MFAISPRVQASDCFDSDAGDGNGIVPGTPGYVAEIDAKGEIGIPAYYDGCLDENVLIEWYCDGGNFKSTQISCGEGKKCVSTGKGSSCGYPLDLDWDQDGLLNKEDNCPEVPNPEQKNTDGDKFGGDVCDKCPTVYDDNDYDGWNWVAGEGGNVVKRFGDKPWEKMPNPWDQTTVKPAYDAKRTITSMWSPDGTMLYAATLAGYLFEWDGTKWMQIGPTGKSDGKDFGGAVYSVHGTGKGDIWLAGYDGMIWHYFRSEWRDEKIINPPKAPGVRKTFNKTTWRSIFAVQDGPVWIVGDGGQIAKRPAQKKGESVAPGTGWSTAKLGFGADLRAVIAGKNKTWIGGVKTGIMCADGDSLQFNNCGGGIGGITILGIAGGGDVIAVGPEGKIAIKQGDIWELKNAPFPNTLTSVWSNGITTVATGLNGVVYPIKDIIQPQYLMRKDIAHPEWTDTRWTSHAGGLEDFWVAGDDMAIATRYDDVWQLVYSDDSVIPFTYGSGQFIALNGGTPAQRSWRDIYLADDETLYAVGNADFIFKRSSGGVITKIPVPASSGPDMRTIRKAPGGGVIAAGNLGLFKISGDNAQSLYPKPASVSVADAWKDEIWLADNVGAHINGADGSWKDIPWNGTKILPVDISSVKSKVVVAGDKVTEASSGGGMFSKIKNYIFGGKSAESYYMASNNGGAWESAFSPTPGSRILGLHPFDETIEACIDYTVGEYCFGPYVYRGMVVMGEKGLVAGRWQGMWVPIDTESSEDWYDGTYDFDWDYDWWLDGADFEAKYWYDLYVLGVGSHNDVSKTHVHHSCEID